MTINDPNVVLLFNVVNPLTFNDDANVLCLGARLIHFKNAKKIINTFMSTKFESGRHTARVKKLDK